MRQQPVNWFEGMFLRPQHFQASDRYWQDSISLATRWQTHYAYGLRSFQHQREALAAYFFQLNIVAKLFFAMARWSKWKIACGKFAGCPASFRRSYSLSSHLETDPRRPNLGDESYAERRSTPLSIEVPDENYEECETEIVFKSPHVRLMLSTDNLEGYETLPIARIMRVGTDEATPQLDSDYFPPLLAADAWNDLAQDCVRAIYDVAGQKVDVLSERATQRQLAFNSQEPGELDDLWMLGQLNQGLAVLHALTFATGVHPYTVYVELCRLVGQLSIFEPTRRLDAQLLPMTTTI